MKKNLGLFVAIGLIGVIGIVWIAVDSSKTAKRATNGSTNTAEATPLFNQELVLTDFAYTPKQFPAGQSQTIKVLLTNNGKSAHTLTFDTLDFTSGNVEPGQSRIVTFTVPSKPGNYNFHSAGPDDKEKDMTGTLVIK